MCISAKEYRLYQLINALRTTNKMPKIELSASLTHVAHLHAADLKQNHPDTSICNLHSWSNKGDWTPCCYQAYVYKEDCMYDKPRELTPYRFRGYELAYKDAGEINPDSLMMIWMDYSKVTDIILSKGDYEGKNWLAIGIGIRDNYAMVWFGQVKDKEGSPKICGGEKVSKEKIPQITNKKNTIIREKTGKYYLIFGSFDKLEEAEQQIKTYFKNGFTNAKIIVSKDKIRIALSEHNDLKGAKEAKKSLDNKYKDAWIMKF